MPPPTPPVARPPDPARVPPEPGCTVVPPVLVVPPEPVWPPVPVTPPVAVVPPDPVRPPVPVAPPVVIVPPWPVTPPLPTWLLPSLPERGTSFGAIGTSAGEPSSPVSLMSLSISDARSAEGESGAGTSIAHDASLTRPESTLDGAAESRPAKLPRLIGPVAPSSLWPQRISSGLQHLPALPWPAALHSNPGGQLPRRSS